MSVFASLAETRHIGAPVVALFRTVFARDPSAGELQQFAPSVRNRVSMSMIAGELVASSEFERRYGRLSRPELVEAVCHNAFGSAFDSANTPPFAASLAETAAELVAAVSEAALARGNIPLLPGLAPGAPPDDPAAYQLWVREYDQQPSSAAGQHPAVDGLLVTVLIVAGDTEAEAVQRSAESLAAQSHANWELCLAARTISPWSRDTIEALPKMDGRVRLAGEANLSAAVSIAAGAFLCLIAPGDTLAPTALEAVVAAFAADPAARMAFTDEDVADASGRHSPRFKPGFSPDALLGGDAIGQLAVYRRELVATFAGSLAEADPIRSLAWRCAAALSLGEALHLPAVLLHRALPPPAIDPGRWQAPSFSVATPPPRVTVVMLTRDHPELLAAATTGVLDRTNYAQLDLVIVDNGTIEPAALALLAKLEAREGVRVLRRPQPFNFAALNNEAASIARPGLLLLLNNDVEVLEQDWLAAMVAQASRPGVGAVGARLLYPDGTVQHAGILLGPNGAATHVGRGALATDPGYMGQLACARDLSAVTGACLAISTDTWRRVGGMDERLAVTWNDVDLCLRVRKAGLRVIWTPAATLLHRESVTRGLEAADAAKLARFREEQALMQRQWGDALERDPFLNPNLLALDSGALVLTRPRRPLASPP